MASARNNNRERWVEEAIKLFTEWDKLFYLWKSFNCRQLDLLKSYVGLALFGCPSNQDILEEVCKIFYAFPKDKRKIITKISSKLEFIKSDITVGCTYLYLDNSSTECVFRQMKPNNEIIFIDCFGRVYDSWNHFILTNKLPDCKYVAPMDGLHKIKQQLRVYKSPAAQLDSKVVKVADVSATTSVITGGILGALAMAPVSAMVLGVVGGGYCVGKSIGALIDRSQHKQSIGLNNAESVMYWSTILTSAVTGASSIAFSKFAQIIEASGAYGNIAKTGLKGLCYAALTCNCCSIGAYVYSLQEKIVREEELTTMDLLEGCVLLFMIWGTVSNVRQMRKYFKSLETAPVTIGRKLTRTSKQDLQDLLIDNNKTVGSGPDVKKVTTLEDNVPSCVFHILVNASQQLLLKHIDISNIYYKCLEIWQTCQDFRFQKISLPVFAYNMINHVQNLINLITNDMKCIKAKVAPFVSKYFFNREVPNSLTEQISHMLDNTTTTVNDIDEKLLENENEPKSTENESKLMYKIIIDVAKNRIPQMIQSDEILTVFNQQLSSLIEEITTEVTDNYEEWVSKNVKMLGKDKANEFFSNSNIKTLNDFANLNFGKVMENKNIHMYSRVLKNDEMLQKMFTLHDSLLSEVTSQSTLSKLGTLQNCNLLRVSLSKVFNPLCEIFKNIKELYEMNSTYIGHQAALDFVCQSFNVKLDRSDTALNLTFFDMATKSLNNNEIINELSVPIMENESAKIIRNQLSDENVQATVICLCDRFYQKVSAKLKTNSDTEREKRIKDSYHYFMENFSSLMQKVEKERNVAVSEVIGFKNTIPSNQKTFISYYRTIYQGKKYETFASVVEHLTQEKNLDVLTDKYIAEHEVADNFHVPVYNHIDDDWIRIYFLDEGILPNLRAYKRSAAKLFDLDENRMELIKWEKGVVILKCDSGKDVIFNTTDIRSMFVMEIDTSKQLNSK